MELDFLPSFGKIAGGLFDRLTKGTQDLINFVKDSLKEDEPFKIRLDPRASMILAKRAAEIPEAKITTPEGIARTAKRIVREGPRSAAELTLKATGRKEFVPGAGVAPEVERFLFGTETIKKPETPLEIGLAVLGTVPFGFGKKQVAKKVTEQLTAKFGKEIANRIVKEGGQDLAQKALLKRGEDVVTRFFAAQRPKSIDKLINAIKKAKPARIETEALFKTERAQRAAKGEAILKRTTGEKGARQALGALKGELPKEKLDSIRDTFKQGEIDELFDMIKHKDQFDFFDKVNTSNALSKLFKGQIPGTAELKQLQKVFGEELIQIIRSKRPLSEKILEGIAEVVNIPRALMSSMDMSAPLRQGIVLSLHKPKQAAGAFNTMVRAFGSQRVFDSIAEDVAARPTFKLMKESGLFLADITSTSIGLATKEEAFLSNYATKIPMIGKLVKASERAYVGFLNKLRADTFDDMAKEFARGGLTPESNPRVFSKLAEFINTATGRGSLEPISAAAPILNGVFFSPRFMASRLRMLDPTFYAQLPQPVRVEAMKSMVKFVGTGIGVLSLASLNDDIDVELDPRSSDFAKIRMGNVRWDIWGGFQQWIRFIAQITTGQIKGISSKEVRELSGKEFPFDTRFDLFMRFVRGKLAPVPALIVDQLDGQKNIIGQESKLDIKIFERMMPIYLQDMSDAIKELGIEGAVTLGVPAFFGVGTQVFDLDELKKSKGGLLPALPQLPKLPALPSL